MALSEPARKLVEEVGRDAARKAARGALFGVGRLDWALHQRQLEARETIEAARRRGVRRAVFLVGRRGGKTRFFMVDAFAHALRHPGWRMPYAALTWESATGFVFPEAEFLASFAPTSKRPAIVDGEVRFPIVGNGATASKIVVKGSDTRKKANDLRGPSAPRAYIDECGFNPVLDYVVKDVITPQLLTTGGMLLMGSSPPESPAHPFASYYVPDARARGSLVTYRTRDAPHVSPEDLAALAVELGGEDSVAYRRECDCELLVDLTRAVVPEWTEHERWIVPSVNADGFLEWWPEAEHRHWYVGADLGYVDLTAVLLAWWDFAHHRLVVEDERILVRPRSETVQMATAEMEAVNGADVVSRIADAQPMTLREMQSYQPAGTPEALWWRPAQKHDREGAINTLRLMVARHELVVHPRCRTLIEHMRSAVWNDRRSDFERSDAEGLGHFDALAALVYLVRSVDRSRNPVPWQQPETAGRWVPPELMRPPSRQIPGRRRI